MNYSERLPKIELGYQPLFSSRKAQVEVTTGFRKETLEIADVAERRGITRHLRVFPQRFLLIKAGLITPSGDGNVHAAIQTVFIALEAHYIRKTAVAHQDLDALEEIEDVLSPEVRVPSGAAVVGGEAVELEHGVRVFPRQLYLPFDELRVVQIVECENVIAVVFSGEQRGALFVRQQALVQSLFELERSTGRFDFLQNPLPVCAAEEVVVKEAELRTIR